MPSVQQEHVAASGCQRSLTQASGVERLHDPKGRVRRDQSADTGSLVGSATQRHWNDRDARQLPLLRGFPLTGTMRCLLTPDMTGRNSPQGSGMGSPHGLKVARRPAGDRHCMVTISRIP